MDLLQQTVHQPSNEVALWGARKPGDRCEVFPVEREERGSSTIETEIHKVTAVYKTATPEVSNVEPWGYFNQLCLYLQNEEKFDHCSRNNRVSEFCGHVVLTIQNQQVSCKTTQGGMSNWRR